MSVRILNDVTSGGTGHHPCQAIASRASAAGQEPSGEFTAYRVAASEASAAGEAVRGSFHPFQAAGGKHHRPCRVAEGMHHRAVDRRVAYQVAEGSFLPYRVERILVHLEGSGCVSCQMSSMLRRPCCCTKFR